MGFFSGQKSSSVTHSYTGLQGIDAQESPFAYQTASTLTPSLAAAIKASQANVNAGVPQLDSNGLYGAQNAGFNVMGKNMFNSVSGDYASRGFNAPENVNGVIGSALTQAAPSLMSQIAANIGQNNTMMNNNLTSLNNANNVSAGALGSNSTMTSNSQGPGIGYGWSQQIIPAAAQVASGGGAQKAIFG